MNMESRKEKEEKALHDVFKGAAERVKEPGFYNKGSRNPSQIWPRTSDSAEPGDEHSHIVKPQGKEWEYLPVTEEDKAIYDGLHIHSQSNPTGMHTHLKGGKSGGAHTHNPQNPLGGHTHKDTDVKDRTYPQGFSIDGHHYHDYNENKPGGQHTHHPENFA